MRSPDQATTAANANRSRFDFEAIGTHWQIETPEALTSSVQAAIADRVEFFDHTYSRFRSDSLVSRLASGTDEVQFPEDAPALFDLYARLYAATDGAMTPLAGASLERLGYDRAYRFTASGPPLRSPRWEDVLTVSGSRVKLTVPSMLDVGAAGKGHLVDIVGGILRASAVNEFLINASGDILKSGGLPDRVALEHPYDSTKAIGIVELTGGAICASASNRRIWGEGLHHVVDGLTGEPVREVVATWVLAEEAITADALATALFFVDAERLESDFDFRYVRMLTDGRADYSVDLPGELFR